MARDVFREVYPPSLNFAAKSSLDGCDSMLYDDWLDIPGVVILILFASNLEWLVTKIPKGIFSQLYFYSHLIRALQQKVKARVVS